MNVLFVCSGNSHYGIVPFIKVQGESLKKEGVLLDYFTIKGKGIINYLKNVKILSRYLKKNNYDLIHAHYGLVGLVCVLSYPRIPIVLSVMGDDAYGSFNLNGKRIKSSYFTMFLTQIALIFSKQIIVKSKNILKVIPYKNKSHIIPNGVNFEVIKPNSKSLEKETLLFLADPHDPRKNFRLVEQALELFPDKKINLLCPYPLEPNQVMNYFNKASVFILTSYNEGSPNVIKEAMACNIPIIATDVGDVREVIERTEGCFLVEFDPGDVADKLKKALAFGKRTTGREDIRHLESSQVAKKIINIYEQVLS
jgi:glycosyltransferase involved in cell wall biosynthesis